MSNVSSIKDTINVRVSNNTAFAQSVNLLGGTSDPLGVPPHLLYQWDLSTETYFGSVTATILISTTANPTPVLYTVPVNGYNIEAVAFALNSLNLGTFQVSGNIIYVSNDFYIYGALTILSTAFVSTWNTNNTSGSSSASNQVKLPLYNGGTYNFTVDWGDGTQNTITSWNQAETLHTYASAGVYTIGIVGTITEWSFFNSVVDDSQKILSIQSWGSLQFGTLDLGSFSSCINLDLSSVTDVPDLSSTITLDNAFSFCTNLTTINNSNSWDTSNIPIFISMFAGCVNFDSNISNWDMANATNINTMFQGCTSFNQPIGSWDVSSVTNIAFLFKNCTQFNQPLNSWNVSLVTDMNSMFSGATNFNQPLNSWDVSNVVNMDFMFSGANLFNGNITSWNTSNVTTMAGMFDSASAFNQNINSWDVSSVTTMGSMFQSASIFNQSLNSWDVSSVTAMDFMFSGATAFDGNITSWNTSNVTTMISMFEFASVFNQNIGGWNVSSVTNMAYMFNEADAFNQSLNSWDVSSVTSMLGMFNGTLNFNGNITSWNTSNVLSTGFMFNNALAFNQNIGGWDVSNVTYMQNMFANANLFNQSLNSWDVSSVTTMGSMFQSAFAFNQDIGSWDISNVTNLSNFMFGKTFSDFSTTNLNAIYNGWSLLSVQPNLTNVNFGTIKYTAGGQAGKNILTGAPQNWIIIDGGI